MRQPCWCVGHRVVYVCVHVRVDILCRACMQGCVYTRFPLQATALSCRCVGCVGCMYVWCGVLHMGTRVRMCATSAEHLSTVVCTLS